MLGHECLELRNQLLGAAARQLGLDALLAGAQPELLERRQGGRRERRVDQIGQRRAAPEGERLVEQPPGLRGVAGGGGGAGALEQRLEAVGVHGVGLDLQHVARRARDQPVAERAAQMRHVTVQRGDRRLGRLVAPHAVDETIDRHHASRLEHEHREHRAPSQAADRDRLAVANDLQRPEDAKLDHPWAPP